MKNNDGVLNIVYDNQWGETTPKWLVDQIVADRQLEALARNMGQKTDKASDAEACAYLYSASLGKPISNEYVSIYMYLCKKLMARKGGTLPEDLPVPDALSERQEELLDDLKHKIWRKRGPARTKLTDMIEAAFKP